MKAAKRKRRPPAPPRREIGADGWPVTHGKPAGGGGKINPTDQGAPTGAGLLFRKANKTVSESQFGSSDDESSH